ncbi:hypothetical protein [Effusibacillus pohliae]|uniref:hypothetical protein n=1 Tax=Effusibacillus pohliae TaxID=232270 RepID=UPI0012EA6324|nr:hypothetical protein [Effusibacillus pohliae]
MANRKYVSHTLRQKAIAESREVNSHGRETTVEEKCYYCGHDLDRPHFVTFYQGNDEQNELLCDECYREWLESMKG